jgi:hypothetical protein
MFTAEELEECDIFPKKVTKGKVLKFLAYFSIMLTACILMYSFYSGRDFSSIVSMESLKYGSDSYYLKKLYQLDNRFDYNISDRYTKDLHYFKTKGVFIKEYVSQSVPVIIKNISNLERISSIGPDRGHKIFQKFFESDNQNFFNSYISSNQEVMVEKRQDPNGFLNKGDFISLTMNYSKFIEEANRKERLANFYIYESFLENLQDDLMAYMKSPEFEFINKYLSLRSQGVKYTEGYDQMINAAHYEYTENLYCQIEGQMDMMILSPLQRNVVSPYKKNYGHPNYSAINFFKAEYGRFPNFREAHRLYITLSKGDCLYLPAYWWFSTKTEEGKHFAYVKFEYKSHSRWVDYIIKGLETSDF